MMAENEAGGAEYPLVSLGLRRAGPGDALLVQAVAGAAHRPGQAHSPAASRTAAPPTPRVFLINHWIDTSPRPEAVERRDRQHARGAAGSHPPLRRAARPDRKPDRRRLLQGGRRVRSGLSAERRALAAVHRPEPGIAALHGERNIPRDTARAMSEENVEVIRAGYAAWAQRDLESWLQTLHPEVEFETSGAFPDLASIYRGHQGMRRSGKRCSPRGSRSVSMWSELSRAMTAPPLQSASAREERQRCAHRSAPGSCTALRRWADREGVGARIL